MKEQEYIYRVLLRLLGMETQSENSNELLQYDWREIVYQSVLHRITPILVNDLKKTGMYKILNNTLYKRLQENAAYIFYTDKIMLNTAVDICWEAKASDLEVLIIKGPLLSKFLYPVEGLRTYSDIDLLVQKLSLFDLKRLLIKKNFIQGYYDKQNDLVIPAKRQEVLERELLTHETVEFHKLNIDTIKTNLVIDINHTLSWKGVCDNKTCQLVTKTIFETKQNYSFNKGVCIDGPSQEMLFLHTCLHLYSEAVLFCWQYSWYKNFGDLELIKYVDIGLFLKLNIDWILFNEYIDEYMLHAQIEYVITQFKALFPLCPIPPALERYMKDCKMVDYYFLCDGRKNYWNISISDRVFNQTDRLKDVKEHTVPGDIMIK